MEKSTEKANAGRKKLKRRKVRTVIKLICISMFVASFVIIVCFVLPIFSKYKAKQKEGSELKEQEKELILERSRLRRIEQYIGTDEYKELYTRYILGYTKPGDEVVDTGD